MHSIGRPIALNRFSNPDMSFCELTGLFLPNTATGAFGAAPSDVRFFVPHVGARQSGPFAA